MRERQGHRRLAGQPSTDCHRLLTKCAPLSHCAPSAAAVVVDDCPECATTDLYLNSSYPRTDLRLNSYPLRELTSE